MLTFPELPVERYYRKRDLIAEVPDRYKLCMFEPVLSPEEATLVAWKATESPTAAELSGLAGDTAPAC